VSPEQRIVLDQTHCVGSGECEFRASRVFVIGDDSLGCVLDKTHPSTPTSRQRSRGALPQRFGLNQISELTGGCGATSGVEDRAALRYRWCMRHWLCSAHRCAAGGTALADVGVQ
jgi:ferredoxin